MATHKEDVNRRCPTWGCYGYSTASKDMYLHTAKSSLLKMRIYRSLFQKEICLASYYQKSLAARNSFKNMFTSDLLCCLEAEVHHLHVVSEEAIQYAHYLYVQVKTVTRSRQPKRSFRLDGLKTNSTFRSWPTGIADKNLHQISTTFGTVLLKSRTHTYSCWYFQHFQSFFFGAQIPTLMQNRNAGVQNLIPLNSHE